MPATRSAAAARQEGGHQLLQAGSFGKIVDTKESNDKGEKDRPYFGEGCIVHMAIVDEPNLTNN